MSNVKGKFAGKHRLRGVSAVELLIAVSVIACIFLIFYFAVFSSSQYSARLSTTATALKWYNESVLDKTYFPQFGKMPDEFEDLFKIHGKLPDGKEISYSPVTIPKEKISSSEGSNAYITVDKVSEIDGKGGWAYIRSEKRICINWRKPLNPEEWPLSNYPELKGNYPQDWK